MRRRSRRSNGGASDRIAALQSAVAKQAGRAVRVGIDLVDVEQFRARFEGRDEFLGSVFARDELAYCRRQRRPWVHLAVRFAAREATLKALGTGLAGEMTFRDVAVVRDVAGVPGLALSGATARVLARAGFSRTTLSLAHARRHAIAVVMLFP